MKTTKTSCQYGNKELTIETGKLARLSGGAVTVTWGDTVVLATTNISAEPRDGIDYLPLMVDYEEKYYAAGLIVGSRFIKREGRPSELAVLTSRLIDRPLRPLFPKEFRRDIQIIVSVLSLDPDHDPSIAATIAASASALLAEAPMAAPIAACRVASVNGELIPHPSKEQLVVSDLDLIVSGTEESIMMIEAGANLLEEEKVIEAIKLGHDELKKAIPIQKELAQILDKKPIEVEKIELDPNLIDTVRNFFNQNKVYETICTLDKKERDTEIKPIFNKLFTEHGTEDLEESGKYTKKMLHEAWEKILKEKIREQIFTQETRIDGRKLNDIREIECEINITPRTHGSSLFTRGYTQILNSLTLGSTGDEQIIDGMTGETKKRYMHHYNFPPYSVGEVRPLRGVGRREIGHGALAEKALFPVIPTKDEFPYTIRLVSEALSSDGSTSMGSTCGSTLSLMAAGVPIKKPISGIAMGLMVNDDGQYKILSDIAGHEDHFGDMDFKVTGADKGITALQMDIKVLGITHDIVKDAIHSAQQGRLHILEKMLATIDKPRSELSPHAPRLIQLKIKPDQIGVVIGPGGKMINEIIDKTGASIDIEDNGSVFIFGTDASKTEEAANIVKNLTKEVVAGEIYQGTVTRVMDFGAFVEILPKQEGLVHISKLAPFHVNKVTDIVNVGDKIEVKVAEIDSMGRINLVNNKPPKSNDKNTPSDKNIKK